MKKYGVYFPNQGKSFFDTKKEALDFASKVLKRYNNVEIEVIEE